MSGDDSPRRTVTRRQATTHLEGSWTDAEAQGDQKAPPLDPAKQAAIWVKKARAGSKQWTKCTEDQFWYYWLSKRTKPIGLVAKYVLVLLTVFNPPSACRGTVENCARLDKLVYSVHLPIISHQVSTAISILMFLVIAFRMYLRYRALGTAYKLNRCCICPIRCWPSSWTGDIYYPENRWHQFTASFVTIGVITAIISFWWIDIRVISFLCRPMVFLGVTKSLRVGMAETFASMPGFIDVLFSFIICVAIFVWMGRVLFAGWLEGAIDFYNWGDGFAKLWTLFTTANSPNAYIPAYNQNRWSFVFFCLYMLLTLFLLSNVLLAKVYDSYKDVLKIKFRTTHENQRGAIQKAFSALADRDTGTISQEKWESFFHAYCDPVIGGIHVGNPKDKAYNLFRANIILKVFNGIDVQSFGELNLDQFKAILAVFFDRDIFIPTRRPPRVGASGTFLQSLQNFFLNGVDVPDISLFGLRLGVIRVQWDRIMDSVIFIGLFLNFRLSMMFVESQVTPNLVHKPVYWILFVFSLFYFIGLNTKMFALGLERFWYRKPLQHRFDFFNVYSLMIAEILYMTAFPTDAMARAIILLRLARGLRLVAYIGPLQQLFVIMKQLVPVFWQMTMLLLIVYYVFAVIGQWCFGGIIYTSNPVLANTGFASGLYWSLNFNDLICGFVTLFLLMCVNNWFIVADGYMLASGTIWCGVFFFLFFVACNFILLNILVALILDGTTVLSEHMADLEEQKRKNKGVPMTELMAGAVGEYSASYMMRKVLDEDDEYFGGEVGGDSSAASDDSADLCQPLTLVRRASFS